VAERFGEVAIRKGFITSQMVHQALKIQRDFERDGRKHKLIGIILIELGMLGTTELIQVLKELSRRDHSTASEPVPAPRPRFQG
jgi:hypothetical protein